MEAQGWRNTSVSLLADNIRADNASSPSQDQIKIRDWSQTGRGSHVDFSDTETIPIVQGRFLGRGSMVMFTRRLPEAIKLLTRRYSSDVVLEGKRERKLRYSSDCPMYTLCS